MNNDNNTFNLYGFVATDIKYGIYDKNDSSRESWARLYLGLNNKYRKNNVEYVPIVLFGKNAEEVFDTLRKGSTMAVKGHISYDSYTKKDGSKENSVSLIVDEVDLTMNRVFKKEKDSVKAELTEENNIAQENEKILDDNYDYS